MAGRKQIIEFVVDADATLRETSRLAVDADVWAGMSEDERQEHLDEALHRADADFISQDSDNETNRSLDPHSIQAVEPEPASLEPRGPAIVGELVRLPRGDGYQWLTPVDVLRRVSALQALAGGVPTDEEWRSAADFMEEVARVIEWAGVERPKYYDDGLAEEDAEDGES